jgi:hypothetical protein
MAIIGGACVIGSASGLMMAYIAGQHNPQDDMMGSMRDGAVDEFFALFNSHGTFLKGFAGTCKGRMTWIRFFDAM